MKQIIYLIRHSGPFVEIENYSDYENVKWNEYNTNMILSVEGEKRAEELTQINELKDIKNIYSSNSFRAISTAKYLAENNNTKIKLDDRINERKFGIDYLNQLPKDFTQKSFDDKTYKFLSGESLEEMDYRFNSFLKELLDKNIEKSILIVHGIMLLSFLQNHCDFKFDGETVTTKFNKKIIIEDKLKSPSVYKITYNDKIIVDIDLINS